MILTCPACATGYFVEDSQIRPEGRQVRCAACGHRWTAHPEPALDLARSPGGAQDESEAAAGADGRLTGDDLPKAFRDRAEEGRRLRKAAVAGAAWTGALVAAAALIGLLALFRVDVVRTWPPTASVYAAVGLPVNPLGLTIEQVRAEPSLQDGHATLSVSGLIRNVAGQAVVAPPLRISLTNAQGKRVAGQIAVLANARIPPGETRRFVTAIFDPPFSAENLQVEFAVGAKAGAAPVGARPIQPSGPPSFALRGPATDELRGNVVEAQPLPADLGGAAPANAATNASD